MATQMTFEAGMFCVAFGAFLVVMVALLYLIENPPKS